MIQPEILLLIQKNNKQEKIELIKIIKENKEEIEHMKNDGGHRTNLRGWHVDSIYRCFGCELGLDDRHHCEACVNGLDDEYEED